MNCVAALSTAGESHAAVAEVVGRLASGLRDRPADLAVVFGSAHHADAFADLRDAIHGRGLARHLIGCTGETIIGEGREVEDGPALSAWAIRRPGAELIPIRIDARRDGLDALAGLGPTRASVVLLGDPFTFAADPWLAALGSRAKGLPVVGGMASASRSPRGNRLLLDDAVYDDGAVALAIDGPAPRIRTLVSQGCRPIGRPLIVTRVERNSIRELGRRPALEVLRSIFEGLSEDDRERAQAALHIGRVTNEYQDGFGRGDFLVRNVMGGDEAGGIVVSDLLRVGQTVQFHVRDAETADEDLRTLIDLDRAGHPDAPATGALLFSCNGRGTRLFAEADHDVAALRERYGPIPVAGFFAMGEFGPIGGQNFVHGFTASVALFEPSEVEADA